LPVGLADVKQLVEHRPAARPLGRALTRRDCCINGNSPSRGQSGTAGTSGIDEDRYKTVISQQAAELLGPRVEAAERVDRLMATPRLYCLRGSSEFSFDFLGVTDGTVALAISTPTGAPIHPGATPGPRIPRLLQSAKAPECSTCGALVYGQTPITLMQQCLAMYLTRAAPAGLADTTTAPPALVALLA
jgi:hypothetical protein